MKLIDLQCSKDSKSKFFACHILDFYKNRVLPLERFPDFSTHTQQVMNIYLPNTSAS